MGWPLSQEYNEAVQNPRTSFADPDLKAGEVVPGPLGIPMPRSGNFADVYQARGPDGRAWALKCFTRPAAELGQRYELIDAHLRAARLPFSVGFQFLREGVRIRGLWYPALKMEWVEGLTLNAFVRENADRPDHLKALLGLWVRLCKRLRDARIAHADLQHGNVLLVPGGTANTLKLRLIDYDGMWVPALADRPTGEAGHPAYQHPARLRDRLYSADVDRFPHLVIGCALRALAVAGKPLWDRFDNGDNLLFREADLADPAGSPVFRALWDLDDPTVTNMVALLVLSARRPLADTPWLDAVLDGEKTAPVSDAILARAADVLGVERRTVRRAAPVAQLYSVPEEANEFGEFGASPRARRGRRRSSSLVPWVAAGGLALAAAAVVAVVLATRGGRPDSPGDPPPPAPPPNLAAQHPGTAGPDARWVATELGQAVPPVKALAAGIDPDGGKGRLVRSFPPRGEASLGAWLLPDGAGAVAGHPTGVSTLDLAGGKGRKVVADLGDLIRLAVSPDGTFLVVAGQDRELHCVDLRTGTDRWTATAPGPVRALAVTPDARRVGTAGPGGLVEWSATNGTEVRRNAAWKGGPFVYTPDGTRAVAAAEEGIAVWHLEDGTATVIGPRVEAAALALSADGAQAFAAGDGKVVHGWAVADGQVLRDRPLAMRRPATALAAAADGTLLVGSQSGEVVALRSDGPPRPILPGGPAEGPVVSIHPTADGRYVLIATEKGEPALCRLAEPPKAAEVITSGALEQIRSGRVLKGARVLAADPAGKRWVAATPGKAVVYDAETIQPVAEYKVPEDRLATAAVGWKDTLLVCEGASKVYARDWEAEKNYPEFSVRAGDGDVTAIRPVYGRLWALVTTARAGDRLFDSVSGKPVDNFPPATARNRVLAAPGPDGELFAVALPGRPVQFWEPATGNLSRACEDSLGVSGLAFTADGKGLVGLWPYGRVRVWDPATGKRVREVEHPLSGEFSEPAGLADGLVLLKVGLDRVVLDVSKDTGKVIDTGTPDPLSGQVAAVPRVGRVLTADDEGKLTVWHPSARRARDLPPATPRPGPWPDARVTRDAPPAPVGLSFAPGGLSVLVSDDDGRLVRYGADTLLQDTETLPGDGPYRAMAAAADRLLLLGVKGAVVRDARSLEKILEAKLTDPGAGLFVADPAGKAVVYQSGDRARLYDFATKTDALLPQPQKALVGRPLTQFAYSADGKTGLARWGQVLTTIWKPGTSGEPKVLEELRTASKAAPGTLAITPDGKTAVLGLLDGRLAAWDVASGKKLSEDPAPPRPAAGDGVVAIAPLPGGTHVLVARADDRTTLYEIAGWKKVREFRGLEGVRRLAVSPDGGTAIQLRPGAIQRLELRPVAKP